MKKIIIISSLILGLNINCVYAQNSILNKIEDALYGFQYESQNDTERLSRIEETVYGEKKTGTNAQRLAKLEKDLAANLLGQEISPVEDTFAESEEFTEELADTGANINYPAVNELEQHVFKQEFRDKKLKDRLAALEEKTFGKTYTDDLSTRVDRLKAEIKPKSLMDNAIAQSSNEYYDEDVVHLNEDYKLSEYNPPSEFSYEDYNARNHTFPFANKSRKMNLSAMENAVLNRSYPNDSTDTRLSRLESQMFGTIFDSDEQEERLNRLSSAYKAQKTATRYDSNRFSQNMATAMQIGTILLMVLACIL